jgi:hypothetical protein
MEESVCVHVTVYSYILQLSCKDVLSVWATEPGESQLAFHGGASESGSSVIIHRICTLFDASLRKSYKETNAIERCDVSLRYAVHPQRFEDCSSLVRCRPYEPQVCT